MRRQLSRRLAVYLALVPSTLVAAPPKTSAPAPSASTSAAPSPPHVLPVAVEGEAALEYLIALATRLDQPDTTARRQLLDGQLTMLRAQKAALASRLRQLQEQKAAGDGGKAGTPSLDEQMDLLRQQIAKVDAEIERLVQEIERMNAEGEERRRAEAVLARVASSTRPGSPDYAQVWAKVPPARRDEALRRIQAALARLSATVKPTPIPRPAITPALPASAAPIAR